jgi:phosphohistidine phosphatase SixA
VSTASLALLVLLLADAGTTAAPKTPAPGAEPPATAVTVLIVRHAEAEQGPSDPGLTESGYARAKCLADSLKGEGVTHLFASPYQRTRDTLGQLALRGRLRVAARDPIDAEGLAAELAALPPDSVAVVAGHSNTVPLLADAFGVKLAGLVEEQGQPALPRDEHDRLVVVRLGPGTGTVKSRVLGSEERRLECAAAAGTK